MLQSLSNYISEMINGQIINIQGQKAQWKKVSELKTGMKIAIVGTTPRPGDSPEFDEIVSIKKIGRKRVYDIEIEGTHNFVGNGILAHNTYIESGNLGIGTTNPATRLGIGGTGATNGITLGDGVANSVNLYRYAAAGDYLKTDDGLIVGGILQLDGNQINSSQGLLGIGLSGPKVGIGTTSPGNLLSIYGADDTIPALGSNGGKLGIFNGTGGVSKYGLIGGVLGTGNIFLQAQRIDGTATAYNMLLQPNGGNVGIGTTAPGAALHLVNSSGTGSGSNYGSIIDYTNTWSAPTVYGLQVLTKGGGAGATTNLYGLYSQVQQTAGGTTTNAYSIYAALPSVSAGAITNKYALFSEGQTILAATSGNVGIGITGPLYPLHIAGTNDYLALQTNSNNSGDNTGILFKTSSVNTDTYFKGGMFYQSTADANGRGNIIFAQNNVADSSNVTPAQAVMIILPNGNVGIGRTNPSSKLDVFGKITSSLAVGTTASSPVAGLNLPYNSWATSPNPTCSALSIGDFLPYRNSSAYYLLYKFDDSRCAIWQNTGSYTDAYEPIKSIEPTSYGDILSAAESTEPAVRKANTPNDKNLVGIVSTKGWSYNDSAGTITENITHLVVAGRVPVKISSLGGNIAIGDAITSSNIPGFGIKSNKAGAIVGKALESFNPNDNTCQHVNSLENISWPEDDGTNPAKPCYKLPNGTYVGKIIAFLNVSWSDPDVYLTDTGDLHIAKNRQDDKYEVQKTNGNIIDRVGVFAQAAIANLTAGLINSQKIISPLAEIDTLHVNVISPISGEELYFKNHNGQTIASIDSTGNVYTEGNITARSATIAGTLHVKKLIADEIETATLSATTVNVTNIYNNYENYNIYATPSASPAVALAEAGTPSPEPTTTPTPEITATPSATPEPTIAPMPELTPDLPEVKASTVSAETVIIQEKLRVLGQTSLASTIIAGTLSVDASLQLSDGNTINALNGPLYLQKMSLGGLNILDGKVTVDRDGNVKIQNNLEIAGVLSGKIISPISTFDLVIKLGGGQKLAVQNSLGQTVASIDSSGSINAKEITIAREATAENSKTEITSNSSAGNARIYKDETYVTVKTPFAKATSLINITAASSTGNKTPYISRMVDGISFTIEIDSTYSNDISLNWWIIN